MEVEGFESRSDFQLFIGAAGVALCLISCRERERGSILVCSSACRMTDTEGKSASCDGECYSVNSCLN